VARSGQLKNAALIGGRGAAANLEALFWAVEAEVISGKG
jgi:hypothetical protein